MINDFYDKHGLKTPFEPNPFPCDHITFANLCKLMFYHANDMGYNVALGPNGGIMFKGIEFILGDKE